MSYRLWLRPLAALPALTFGLSSLALAQDSDGDGVVDTADAYPCDPAAAAIAFAPAEGVHGSILTEDHWPLQADLDFNDLALSYNITYRMDAAGRTLNLRAVFNTLAVGGTLHNGLGWHLPVPPSAIASATRTIFGGATTPLVPASGDAEATFVLSEDLRELFGGREGAINAVPGQPVVQGQVMIVDITFATPAQLSAGASPDDLFIFRSSWNGHEIHRPEYVGTSRMDNTLFGTFDDGSGGGRNFVDYQGLPFMLVFPTVVAYPKEFTPISDLYPNILQYAASGGASSQDFYTSQVVATHAYTGAPTPALPAGPAIDRSCVPTLVARPDSVSVVQGQQLSVPFATLLANDSAGSGGGTLTITSVGSAFGGTVSISGTNVLFTSTGLTGQGAGFTYVMRNALGHTDAADVTVTVQPLPAVQAIMVDTQADLDRLTVSGSGYTPPTPQEIFNTWRRFSHGCANTDHGCRGTAYPASTTDLNSWRYNSTLNSVESTANTPSYIGFVSPEALSHYTYEVTMSASSASGDNDAIGVIIAFVTEGTPGTPSYREHTLTAMRNRGSDSHTRTAGVASRWHLSMNYKQSTERVLANGSATAGGSVTTVWNSSATRTRVRVNRQGDIITVACSQFGSDVIDANTTLSIDLSQDPELYRFRGAQPWGLSAHSQANTYFQSLVFTGGLNANVVYDVSVNPSRVWDYTAGTGSWSVRPSATAQSVLGCPRRVDRPVINTLNPAMPAMSFQLDCNGAYRL
jgi:LruC domain-containing protein